MTSSDQRTVKRKWPMAFPLFIVGNILSAYTFSLSPLSFPPFLSLESYKLRHRNVVKVRTETISFFVCLFVLRKEEIEGTGGGEEDVNEGEGVFTVRRAER